MADTVTPKLGLVKPEINGQQTENVWGYDLNNNFDKIDASYGAFVSDAPMDGSLYGRSNATWVYAAPLISPAFIGIPTTPNVNPADNSLTIANTKFVKDVLVGYAPLADPIFTGNPRAPTPVPGDNDTSIATTAFVTAFGIAAGAVLPSNTAPGMNGTPNAGTSALYSRGDHTHPSDTSRVAKAGDTMTGNLAISSNSPTVVLTKTASGQNNQILGQTASSNRWLFMLGDGGAEGAGNAGSDLSIHRYANDGAYLGTPFTINRANGTVAIAQQTAANGVLFANSGVASSSYTTGSMVVTGGLGVSGNVNVHGGIVGDSFMSLAGSLTMGTGALINLGGQAYLYGNAGAYVAQSAQYIFASMNGSVTFMSINASAVSVNLATATTHYSTGALVVTGGVGVGGGVNAGGWLRAYDGRLFLQGHGGDPNQGAIFFNANQNIYLHSNGTSNVSLVGLPLRLNQGGDILGGGEWSLWGYANQSRGRFFHDNTNLWMQATALQFCGLGGAPATSTFTGPASTSTSTGAVVVSGGLGVTGSANLGPTTVYGGLGCTGDFYTSTVSYLNAATPSWVAGWNVALAIKFTGANNQFGIGLRPIYDSTTAIGFVAANGLTAVGNIYMTDVAVAYGTASDARLKSDLKPLESGDLIDRIKTYDFCWQNGKRGRGVLAQEAAKVVPEACYEQADTWFTDYSKFVPLLLAEMKALRARVAELEGRA